MTLTPNKLETSATATYTTTDGKAILNNGAVETTTHYAVSVLLDNQQDYDFKKIAIIGCGYVGMALAHHWQQQGHFVTATTTRKERITELEKVATQVVVMKGENSQAMGSLLQNQDTVMLSIAPIRNRQIDAQAYRETYIPTAQNLVAALKDTHSVKQVIYLSSCSLYGDKKGERVDEASPVDTTSEYNQVLFQTEQLLLDSASENIKVCILRLGGIYGPKRELTRRLAQIAGQTIPGNGESIFGWIHLEDIIAAINFLSQRKLGGIYNLVNDLNLPVRELYDLLCDRQGLERIRWDASQPDVRPFNVRIENQKIKAAGYKLIHPEMIV